ncbi:hypothetical protein C5167_039659, partial [Papaver somniferum]
MFIPKLVKEIQVIVVGGDENRMMKLVKEIVAVLVVEVVVEIWCDFGGWEMVVVVISCGCERRK